MSSWHFSGIGGSGMSAIALYLLGRGETVSGSDRLFDHGGGTSVRAALETAGARIVPQDGRGIPPGALLVVSTAVESDTPELVAARVAGCRVLHRSEALAEIAAGMRTIAVSGTSGKSTVTAMVFAILREAGLSPSVVSGAALRELSELGLWGNAFGGTGEWLVIEADESDGSLVRYAPEIGLLLNIDRDHKELDELEGLFRTFRSRSKVFCTNGDRTDCRAIAGDGALLFGLGEAVSPRPEAVELGPRSVSCRLDGQFLTVPFPGRHVLENALAAVATARAAGATLEQAARALAGFRGVARRHEIVGEARGVRVFDDFAHNPAKVDAALEAAHAEAGSGRVLALFQPHGYGPLRFLLEDFAEAFARALRPDDELWLLPVYDAGGTADRSVGSADLAEAMARRGRRAFVPERRDAVPPMVAATARAGDLVYSMGARDPDLPAFAGSILAALSAT